MNINTHTFNIKEKQFLEKIKNPTLINDLNNTPQLNTLFNKFLKNGESFLHILIDSYDKNSSNIFLEQLFIDICKNHPETLLFKKDKFKPKSPIDFIYDLPSIYIKHEELLLKSIQIIHNKQFPLDITKKIIHKSQNKKESISIFLDLIKNGKIDNETDINTQLIREIIKLDDVELIKKINKSIIEKTTYITLSHKIKYNVFTQSIQNNSINLINYFLSHEFSNNEFKKDFYKGTYFTDTNKNYCNPYNALFENSLTENQKHTLLNCFLEILNNETLFSFFTNTNSALHLFYKHNLLEDVINKVISSQNKIFVNLAFQQLLSLPSLIDPNKDYNIFETIYNITKKNTSSLPIVENSLSVNILNQYHVSSKLTSQEQSYFFKIIDLLAKNNIKAKTDIFDEKFLLDLTYSKPFIDSCNLLNITSTNPISKFLSIKKDNKPLDVINYLEIKCKELFVLPTIKHQNVISTIISYENSDLFKKFTKKELQQILYDDNFLNCSFVYLLKNEQNKIKFNDEIILHLIDLNFNFLQPLHREEINSKITLLDYIHVNISLSNQVLKQLNEKNHWNIEEEIKKDDYHFWRKISNPYLLNEIKKQKITQPQNKIVFEFCQESYKNENLLKFIDLFPDSINLKYRNKNLLELCISKDNYFGANELINNYPQLLNESNSKNELPLIKLLNKIDFINEESIKNGKKDIVDLFLNYMNKINQYQVKNTNLKESLKRINTDKLFNPIKKLIEVTLLHQELASQNNTNEKKLKI